MQKDLQLWQFIRDRLAKNQEVMLLVVGESTGSSPGRQGYKMAVSADGGLCGSIGGGVMEVELVEQARAILSGPRPIATGSLIEQVHRRNAEHASGMICSGQQTVILKELTPEDLQTVNIIYDALTGEGGYLLLFGSTYFSAGPDFCGTRRMDPDYSGRISFERHLNDFKYSEELNSSQRLFIIGGGHCALALSELMSRMDFQIHILDDRPELNTIEKNRFADRVTIVDSYHKIAEHIPPGDDVYVVVMTLGYLSDAVVIRKLIDHQVKYFGVLGSKAKMATLIKELSDEGLASDKLSRIRTPIGLPINSRTPEEIAVSIAAEIISVKNL
ncbi:MAG: XdhC family protein [Chloracidobacterium sp.]|nr:XdhC family protein [Chloracidobacterium sp.]